MIQRDQKKFIFAFWLISLAEFSAIFCKIEMLHYIAKPLLIPVLILLLHFQPSSAPGKIKLLAGLFFSWMGDVLLMFDSFNPLFFILGLICFLTTHIFYIIYFLGIRSQNISLLKKQPVWVVVVLAYGTWLVWLLFPHLDKLAIPVMVYASVICSMLLCSFHVYLKQKRKPAALFLLGAVFFVLSDSLLAINKFYQPFAIAGVLIMLTYCAAQFFIVLGFLKKVE